MIVLETQQKRSSSKSELSGWRGSNVPPHQKLAAPSFTTFVNKSLQKTKVGRRMKLLSQYQLENQAGVLHFIERHPEMTEMLLEASQEIKKYFPQSKLVLELTADLEESSQERLGLYICTILSADETYERLKMLDHNWWLDASVDISNLFIHVDFDEV